MSLVVMHVVDVVLDSFSNLLDTCEPGSHRYSPAEKLCSVILFTAGLSLRDLSERLSYRCVQGIGKDTHRYSNHQRELEGL
jgi:hypothetical protein